MLTSMIKSLHVIYILNLSTKMGYIHVPLKVIILKRICHLELNLAEFVEKLFNRLYSAWVDETDS